MGVACYNRAMKILYKDKDFFVVDKPPGIDVADIALKFDNAFLVHRLDKDTSGILVMAKTEAMQKKLQDQWKKRKVKKTYLALVKGRITPQRGRIDSPIGRSHHNRKKMAVSRSVNARPAETEYKVKKYFNDATLVEAYPKTGRTHQIRVHFSAIGHPVIGDKTYGDPKLNKKFEQYGLKRQFLHAVELTIMHPKNKKIIRIKSLLPRNLRFRPQSSSPPPS